MLANRYQQVLILSSVFVAVFLGYFFYKELFPEYKVYQNAYVGLEELRAEATGKPVPPFKGEVKQIVIPQEDLGPEVIDRCMSCHVAVKLPHFSATKISYDINGNMEIDAEGHPVLTRNEDYIWDLVAARGLEELRHQNVGGIDVDMSKVL